MLNASVMCNGVQWYKKRIGLILTNCNPHLLSCAVTKLKTKKICSSDPSFFCKSNESMFLIKNLFKKGMYCFLIYYYYIDYFYNISFRTVTRIKVIDFTQ